MQIRCVQNFIVNGDYVAVPDSLIYVQVKPAVYYLKVGDLKSNNEA